MAFTEQEVAEIVRHRLGDVDAARRARIVWAIPQALDRLARKVAQNPKKRHLLTTPKSTLLTLTAAEIDLVAYAANPSNKKILLEYLDHGTFYYAGLDLVGAQANLAKARPIQRVRNVAFADNSVHDSHPFSDDFFFYVIEGGKFRMLSWGAIAEPSGPVYAMVPYSPKLTELASIVELHDDFIDKVIEVCTGPGSDAAEDLEH